MPGGGGAGAGGRGHVERSAAPREERVQGTDEQRQRDDHHGEALEASLPRGRRDVLHLEHVRQDEGERRGGDEREQHREDGEGRDVEPDEVDDADVGRLDGGVEQHAQLGDGLQQRRGSTGAAARRRSAAEKEGERACTVWGGSGDRDAEGGGGGSHLGDRWWLIERMNERVKWTKNEIEDEV